MWCLQYQIVPCSSLYLFSGSIGVPQIKCRVLICFICYLQSSFLFFVCFVFLCKSLQGLFLPLTQRGEGGHLYRLTCSVVLWGGRDTANRYHWHVWRVLAVDGPHWVCHSPRCCVLPRSTLLSLQGALREHCSKRALHFVHFPGLTTQVLVCSARAQT